MQQKSTTEINSDEKHPNKTSEDPTNIQLSPLFFKETKASNNKDGTSIHSSSISLSPTKNCNRTSNKNYLQTDNNDNKLKKHSDELYQEITADISIKERNSNPFVYYALKQSLKYFVENISESWKSSTSLNFIENGLEHYFRIYFAHRYLLTNQGAFLVFSLFYIVILFIFDIKSKYEWISVTVHCILIIIIFISLILSLTDKFKIYIHRLTSIILFTILCGLDIQAFLAEIPISAHSILSIILVLFGFTAFLSIQYNHIIIVFTIFLFCTNTEFIILMLTNHNKSTKFTHFLWFNLLLLFIMICSAHLIRLFEIQERKLFLKVLKKINETRNTLQRQLTVYETVSIAQLIDNDRSGNDNDVLDKLLHQFIFMGGLFQHLPDVEWKDSSHYNSCCDDEDIIIVGDEDEQTVAVVIKDDHPAHLCSLKELPEYYRGYPYLPIGYRLNYSYREAITSIFQWHNETVNLWTEILPLVLNIFSLSWYITHDTLWNELIISDKCMFIISATLILIIRPICSILAHSFYIISPQAHDFWWRVDYSSICITMLCEGIVGGSYTFNCNYQLKILFFTCVSCMFLSTMLSTLVSRSIQIRAASFCLFVLFCTGCPFLYQWILYASSKKPELLSYLIIWTIAYILAIFALLIKSLWFPERCCSTKRNCLSYVGASHQIWHVLINSCLSLSVYCWVVYLQFKYKGHFVC